MLELKLSLQEQTDSLFDRYVEGDSYAAGLQAAKTAWRSANAFRLSALYIYLNLMTIPVMMHIELSNSHRLNTPEGVIKDLMYTRIFLQNVVGLAAHDEFQGGIRNPLVAKQVIRIGAMHQQFGNIQDWMMNYLGYIIAIAPMKVMVDEPFSRELRTHYYQYMHHAWSLMGVNISAISDGFRTDTVEKIQSLAGPIPGLTNHLITFRKAYTTMFGAEQMQTLWQQALLTLDPPVAQVILANLPRDI